MSSIEERLSLLEKITNLKEKRLTSLEEEISNLKEKIDELNEDLKERKRINSILSNREERKVFELAQMMERDCDYLGMDNAHDNWTEELGFNKLYWELDSMINSGRSDIDLHCYNWYTTYELCKNCKKHIDKYVNDNKI